MPVSRVSSRAPNAFISRSISADDLLAFAPQIKQRVDIGKRGRYLFSLRDRLFQPLALLHDFLAFFRLIPESGIVDFLLRSSLILAVCEVRQR